MKRYLNHGISLFCLIAITLVICCSKDPDSQNTTITDKRDGKSYKIVTIKKQVWLAENLNYAAADSSWLYDNDTKNNVYGRLYTWSEAQHSCPAGWRLPDEKDWDQLIDNLGGGIVAGQKLKEAGSAHWNNKNTGNNSSQFNALPGGERYGDGGYNGLTTDAYFWSSKAYGGNSEAYNYNVEYNTNYANKMHLDKDIGMSVRCIKDLPRFPSAPSTPTPADKITDYDLPYLSWKESVDPNGDSVFYDIYYGESNPPSLAARHYKTTKYFPYGLLRQHKYYWKIIAINETGYETAGPVWEFTTGNLNQIYFNPDISYTEITDNRDGQKYKTVKIGTQTWMAQNVDYPTAKAHYPNNDSIRYKGFGRLYIYTEAKTVCPSGWHLPSKDEWNILFVYAKDIQKLIESGYAHWISPPKSASNELGFTALGAGYYSSYQSFFCTSEAFFWTSTEVQYPDVNIAHFWPPYLPVIDQQAKDYNLSVRCIKD